MDWNDYKRWMDKWLAEVFISLKPNGSLYICSDWNTSIAVPEIAGKYFLLKTASLGNGKRPQFRQ